MKNIIIKRIILALLLAVFIFGAFFLGVHYGLKTTSPLSPPERIDFSLLWEIVGKLEKEYPKPLDYQKIIYGAASGLVESLGDPYTVFFTPEESKIFEEDIAGEFEGVGMEIGIRNKELTVIAPLEGTPAQKAGLRAGDKILKINDISTTGMSLGEAVKLIRGPKGTKVRLTISREGWEEAKEFTITRGVIQVPSLKWEIKEIPETGESIAYIKIYQFSEKLHSDFREAAFKILNSPAKKIILDLRNNPGGLLEEVQDIAGWFLKRGDIVTTEDFGEAKGQEKYKAKGNSLFLNYPTVVLINKGSASGAEILAAALRDNRGVKLIGETSFGKGTVQKPISLRGGAILKVTVAQWLTPKGESITGSGLKPDYPIEMTEEDYEAGYDPQLEKAIEILRGL
ncbi:S41 family peptidase [bacterium]|nr:S41 family peptidase [bacterium]